MARANAKQAGSLRGFFFASLRLIFAPLRELFAPLRETSSASELILNTSEIAAPHLKRTISLPDIKIIAYLQAAP
jgi:hypothetical protein